MREIELWTRDGHFVAVVDIPPFPDGGMPDVVMWGDRVFHNNAGHQTDGSGKSMRWVYNEVFSCVSLTPSPGRSRTAPDAELAPLKAIEDRILHGPETTTLHGTPVDELREQQAREPTGMHKDYIVLSEHERAKGFVRPVRHSYIHLKCGTKTTMGIAIAETYARDISFYSGTYCCGCGAHFPVGEKGEFVWDGTDEKVGT